MRWLVLLSRVAFLSGIVMLVALFSGATSWHKAESGFYVAILAGYGLSAVLLPLTGLLYLLLSLVQPHRLQTTPRWLMISNILLLLIFLFFTFYYNDPYYHQR